MVRGPSPKSGPEISNTSLVIPVVLNEAADGILHVLKRVGGTLPITLQAHRIREDYAKSGDGL